MKKLLIRELIEQQKAKVFILDSQILLKYKPLPNLSDERNEDFLEYKRREANEALKYFKQLLNNIEAEKKLSLEQIIERQESQLTVLNREIFYKIRPFPDLSDKKNNSILHCNRIQAYKMLKDAKQELDNIDRDEKLVLKELIKQEEENIIILDDQIANKFQISSDVLDEDNEKFLLESRNQASEKLKDYKQELDNIEIEKKLIYKDLIEQQEGKILILDSQISNKFKTFPDLSDEVNENYLFESRIQSYEILKDFKLVLNNVDIEI